MPNHQLLAIGYGKAVRGTGTDNTNKPVAHCSLLILLLKLEARARGRCFLFLSLSSFCGPHRANSKCSFQLQLVRSRLPALGEYAHLGACSLTQALALWTALGLVCQDWGPASGFGTLGLERRLLSSRREAQNRNRSQLERIKSQGAVSEVGAEDFR